MPAKGISKNAVNQWIKQRKSGGPVYNKKGTRVPGMFQDGGVSGAPRRNPLKRDLEPNPFMEKNPFKGPQRKDVIKEQSLYDQYKDAGVNIPFGHIDSPDDKLKMLFEDQFLKKQEISKNQEQIDKFGPPHPGIDPITTKTGDLNIGDLSNEEWNKLHSDKRSEGIGNTGGAKNPNNPDEYGTLWDDGTFQKEGNYSDHKKKSTSDIFMQKRGGQKRKAGGAVFNRNGVRVPGMRKGR